MDSGICSDSLPVPEGSTPHTCTSSLALPWSGGGLAPVLLRLRSKLPVLLPLSSLNIWHLLSRLKSLLLPSLPYSLPPFIHSFIHSTCEALPFSPVHFSFPFFFFFLATLCGLWDFSAPTRDRTWALGNESTES